LHCTFQLHVKILVLPSTLSFQFNIESIVLITSTTILEFYIDSISSIFPIGMSENIECAKVSTNYWLVPHFPFRNRAIQLNCHILTLSFSTQIPTPPPLTESPHDTSSWSSPHIPQPHLGFHQQPWLHK